MRLALLAVLKLAVLPGLPPLSTGVPPDPCGVCSGRLLGTVLLAAPPKLLPAPLLLVLLVGLLSAKPWPAAGPATTSMSGRPSGVVCERRMLQAGKGSRSERALRITFFFRKEEEEGHAMVLLVGKEGAGAGAGSWR